MSVARHVRSVLPVLPVLFVLFGSLASFVTPETASAQQAPLVIADVVPDAGSGTLTIAGSGFGSRPLVTLDLIPLDVQLSIDARIIAAAPIAAMPSGRYLLTVTRGTAVTDSASRHVTIGPERSDSPATPALGGTLPPVPAAAETAATVGDRRLSVADVDREWQRTDPAGYLSLMRDLYESRRRVVNAMVADDLLAREAAARGVTTDALLKDEIPKRTIAMPDAAVTSLYLSLGDCTRGATIEQMRPALRAWLAEHTEPELAKMNYVEELMKTSTRAEVLLAGPRVDVESSADDPALGPPTAAVVLVVFGDLQSTDYVRFVPAFARVRDMFGNRVRLVFKHLPTFGPSSEGAAQAAACAHAQGRFWEFQDAAAEPGSLESSRLRSLAADVGLDRRAFDSCVDNGTFRDLSRKAVADAARYGIMTSPAFLVNGRMAPESPAFLPPMEYFKRLIEEELQRQARAGAAR